MQFQQNFKTGSSSEEQILSCLPGKDFDCAICKQIFVGCFFLYHILSVHAFHNRYKTSIDFSSDASCFDQVYYCKAAVNRANKP